ncbi:MAG: carboxyl-terminal processing protease [Thermomicrobiales bacterium]|nr:carboxyl-terminal processing protease [Thermomicrobiales bacterium]
MLTPSQYEPTTAGPEPGTVARIRRATLAMVLVVVFCGGVVADRLVFQGGSGAGASSSLQDLPEFQTLLQTWDTIHQNYVDTDAIEDKALIYGASRGMVDALGDTGHSSFLDPEEAQLFAQATQGEFVGIGIQLDYGTGRPVIVSAIDDSPAAEAGFRSRDVIEAINGESTDGMSQSRAAELLRGEAGTQVELSIERPSDGTSFTTTVTRRKIKIKPVSWTMLPDDVGLIRLSEFSPGAADGVKSALKAIKAEGARSIILDLRDNPGGLVDEAKAVASQFMKDGTPIYQYQERDQEPQPVRTVGDGLGTDLPMVVLINEGSASAAEIVASGLQDNGRAKLFGAKTFGTGTVLTAFPLDDGSVVVLGIGLWLTPDGDEIWHKGVQPDVQVDLAPDADPLRPVADDPIDATDLKDSRDVQLKEAYEEITTPDLATAP